jgi:hypothetical protein
MLQQSATELPRKREETARELAAVVALDVELDRKPLSAGATVDEMDLDPVSPITLEPPLRNTSVPGVEVLFLALTTRFSRFSVTTSFVPFPS